MKNLLGSDLLNNVFWFGLSLITAFFIWVIATFQVDPIIIQRLPQSVSIQIQIDPGLLITNNPRTSAIVTVRGQESVLSTLTSDDITVRADLIGMTAGDHIIPLIATIGGDRRAVIDDISPRQLRVTLEEISQEYVNIEPVITGSIPVGYESDPPTFDVSQVLISGASNAVTQTVAVQAQINLNDRRNSFEESVNLVPVDINGTVVMGLTLEPAQVTVNVAVRQRDDIREIAVTPNIVIDDLPEGYRLTSATYDPQTILVGGAPELLTNMPNTLFTEPIDLAGRTTSFDVTVPVILPSDNLLVLSSQTISVSIGIAPLETTKRFDDVTVGVIGLAQGYSIQLVPPTVTVLLTGPQPVLNTLNASSIQVVIDLNGLEPGNYQLTPSVSVNGVDISADNIAVLPAEIDILITNGVTATPTPTATLTATP
ncbi:MAG: CdaR family protein [Anaerolineae bacterium]